MKHTVDEFMEERAEYFNMRKFFLKYWLYRKKFIISACICVCLYITYICIAIPQYDVTASVTIHDEERGGSKNAILSVERLFYSGRDWLNTENEIEVLLSTSLIEKVVTNLNLHTSYYQTGFLKNILLYNTSPIKIEIDKNINQLRYPIIVTITNESDASAKIKVETTMDDDRWEKVLYTKEFPIAIESPNGTVTINGNWEDLKNGNTIKAVLNNPVEVAKSCAENLSIEIVSRTSSVVKMSYNSPNRDLGIDFLEELIRCYNLNANYEKNRIAKMTAEFLEERLTVIDKELKFTDQRLEEFKRNAGLTDIDIDTKEYLQENSLYTKEMLDAETQLYLLKYLQSYVTDKKNEGSIVPGNIGLSDPNISKIIDNHNQLILEFQRLSRTSSKNNPISLNLKNQIQASLKGVVNALSSAYSAAVISKNEIENKVSEYNSKIRDVPAYERQLAEIIRQQETKASLYLDLMQKLEENSLMIRAVTENAKFIDAPYSKMDPSSPNKKILFIIALVISGFACLIWIYIKEAFSKKILRIEEIEKNIPLQNIVGKIHWGEKSIADVAKLSTYMRLSLRDSDEKVIGLFSGQKGDGKSYISSMLGSDFAQCGKKTLIIKMHECTSGTARKQFAQWPIFPVSDIPYLYECIWSDSLSNLQWVVSNPKLENYFLQINSQFDYIFIDSISYNDLPCISELIPYTGLSAYVCRIGHSSKSCLDDFCIYHQQNLLIKSALIVNNI